jgi:hypothetical protein
MLKLLKRKHPKRPILVGTLMQYTPTNLYQILVGKSTPARMSILSMKALRTDTFMIRVVLPVDTLSHRDLYRGKLLFTNVIEIRKVSQ